MGEPEEKDTTEESAEESTGELSYSDGGYVQGYDYAEEKGLTG
jgi:hypothetical protein